MQQLSRTLVRTGIFLVTFGVMMGLLLMSGGLGWTYDGVVLTGLRYTAVFAYVACPIALAGGIGTGLAGLALKAVIRAHKLGQPAPSVDSETE